MMMGLLPTSALAENGRESGGRGRVRRIVIRLEGSREFDKGMEGQVKLLRRGREAKKVRVKWACLGGNT